MSVKPERFNLLAFGGKMKILHMSWIAFFITFFGLSKLGGWGELVQVCKTNADQFALWRPNSDPDFPWLGILIASPVIGIWYWCTDQYIVAF